MLVRMMEALLNPWLRRRGKTMILIWRRSKS